MTDSLTPNTAFALMQAAQEQSNQAADKIKSAAQEKNAQFDEVAQDFEAMFITEMMKPMFENVKPNELTGGGKGEEIFQGLMLQEYGKMMAQTGQLGIAEQVKEELIRLQEQSNAKPNTEE